MTAAAGELLEETDVGAEGHASGVMPAAAPASDDALERLLALPVGVHEDVPERVYHARALGLASNSALDCVRRSLAHYRAWVDGLVGRETAAFHLGKAVHCAVLEPGRFEGAYVIAPDFGDCRRRENKLARDAWRKAHEGATVLRAEEGAATMGMIRSLASHSLVASLVDGARVEVTLRWDDEDTGVPCKGRVDLDRSGDLYCYADLKTTLDASYSAFSRAAYTHGYYRRAAFYLAGARALGLGVRSFVLVAVEKTAPHEIALYELEAAALEQGDYENRQLLRRLADAVERDEWPGYPDAIQPLKLPRWAVNE